MFNSLTKESPANKKNVWASVSQSVSKVRFIDVSKFPTGVNVSANSGLTLCVNPVTHWRSVQGVPHLLAYDTGIGSSSHDPELGKQDRMDECTDFSSVTNRWQSLCVLWTLSVLCWKQMYQIQNLFFSIYIFYRFLTCVKYSVYIKLNRLLSRFPSTHSYAKAA